MIVVDKKRNQELERGIITTYLYMIVQRVKLQMSLAVHAPRAT